MLRRLLPVALLVAGVAAVAALIGSRPKPPAIEIQEKAWIVAVMAAQPQRLHPALELYARAESLRAATLRSALDAELVEVFAREGNDAGRGTLLVELDASDAQLQLTRRQADVDELRAELEQEMLRVATDRSALKQDTTLAELAHRAVERAQRLAKRDLGSAAVLDEARQEAARQSLSVENRRFAIAVHQSRVAAWNARMSRAQSLLAMARLDLQRTRIRAPFDARIASVRVARGDRVRAGDALVDVFDAQAMELRAQVPDRYLASLRAGLSNAQPVMATSVVGGTTIRAHLDRLGARIERGRAGTDAFFRVEPGAAGTLELGRTVQLFVALPAVEDAVPVPAEALYGIDRIYLLVDSRMRAVTVQRIGEYMNADGEHRLLVKSDRIGAGARIVITQLPSAVDGLKVRVVE